MILNTVHNENHSKTIFGQVVVKILSLNDLWEGVVAGPAQSLFILYDELWASRICSGFYYNLNTIYTYYIRYSVLPGFIWSKIGR